MMTTFPFLTCCELLSIDPKTLRSWLRQAHMSLHTHPTDARMKCLTSEQVQRLAVLHGRALKPHEAFAPEHAEPIVRIVRKEAEPMAQREPISQQDEMARRKQIAALEAQVASLQEQLAHLRTPAYPVTLSDSIQQAVEPVDGQAGQADRQSTSVAATIDEERYDVWTPLPAESRRRPILPLIEYGATDSYVVVCPQQGELSLLPDSAQWFAWLASLSSFRFVGKQGRLSACRGYDHGPLRKWYAYRIIHQHNYKHYLGTTDHLTIACLEQAAARLQAYVE